VLAAGAGREWQKRVARDLLFLLTVDEDNGNQVTTGLGGSRQCEFLSGGTFATPTASNKEARGAPQPGTSSVSPEMTSVFSSAAGVRLRKENVSVMTLTHG
jgi:hypothetical protein